MNLYFLIFKVFLAPNFGKYQRHIKTVSSPYQGLLNDLFFDDKNRWKNIHFFINKNAVNPEKKPR